MIGNVHRINGLSHRYTQQSVFDNYWTRLKILQTIQSQINLYQRIF